MGRISAAFRIFFKTLSDANTARQVENLLAGAIPTAPEAAIKPATDAAVKPPAPSPSTQNTAITLLAALQREARLIDFLKEDLAAHPDALIGAAAREVHRDAGQLLERLFAIRPLRGESEGTVVQVVPQSETGRVRLVGNVMPAETVTGALKHHGWEVTRCELPTYTGSADTANILAPAEVEIA